MAFRPEPTIYKLEFDEDTGLAGLTVRAKCCSMGEFNMMLRGSQDPGLETAEVDEDDPKAMAAALAKVREYSNKAATANEEAVKMFLRYVVDWDLGYPDGAVDDQGNPYPEDAIVPLTVEGLQAVEKPTITAIIGAWHMAMMAVPLPLNKASTNGRRSEEASLGLDAISASPPSWPKPS